MHCNNAPTMITQPNSHTHIATEHGMSYSRFIVFIILIALFFCSCSHREAETLKVTSSLPAGERSSTGQMLFQFSKLVVPVESVGVMMKTPFIAFSPEIPGMFVWQDTSTLIFSPDSVLRGDTKYKGEINSALLLQYSGMKSFEGEGSFEFATESFRMKSAEFFYDRVGERRLIGIKANIEFTYAVNPTEIQNLITVKIDGEQVSGVTVVTPQASRVIPIEIGTVTQNEKDKVITIEFPEQLVSTETKTHIKADKPFSFTLPGIGHLKIYGHDFGFDGTTSWITINTSQEIDSSKARQFISITPHRDFTLETSRNSLTMKGKFEPGSTFRLVIKTGLESILEAKTENDYNADILIGNIKPTFRFGSTNGSYLLLGGEKNIELKTLNLTHLYIRVSQVFQNNLVFFLESGRQYDWGYYDYDDEGNYYEESNNSPKYRYYVGNYGRSIWSDTIPISMVKNQEISTKFDISPYIKNDYKGFYVVEISNPEEQWRSTSKLISLSNLGLIVKNSNDQLVVFANNLLTTEPASGATIQLISTNNQTIASMKADGDGVARFDNFRELKKDFYLKLVTAELDNDYNYINLQDYRIETSRFDVGGKYENERQYDAFIYGDRTLYRPGETLHVSGIVRILHSTLPPKMPVKVKIISPRGNLIKELRQTLNEEGSFDITFPTSTSSLTGTYTLQIYTGNDIFLTDYYVSVEDFVPDRLKVNLKASKESAGLGEKIVYTLEALNFFGPPAAGRNYEFEGTFQHIPFYSKNYRDFRFSDESAKNTTPSPTILTGKTDTEGKGTIEFEVPTSITSNGVVKAHGRVAVFDESGRPVYQVANTIVHPKNYYIGLKNYGDYYQKPQSPQRMQIVVVGKDDKPINGFNATIEVIRMEWHSVLRQYQGNGALRYVSELREVVEHTENVTLSSQPYDYKYSTSRSGDYRVRVSKAGDTGYNQFSFYSYSWGTSDVTSFDINPEARVDIVLNDSVYAPGEKAKILFKAPFSGKMLVTVERNQVYSYHFLDVKNNAASLEIPIEEKFLPNVYISAVLFRKITDLNIPLLVGHGFVPLFVEKKSNNIPITINAPEKIRPKTKQSITIKAGNEKNIFVTIAAVDEGILQLKNYQTPNPYKYFYARKALQTETYDFFKNLLPELGKSKTGGSDAELGQKVNPLGVLRFKPLALWSGILKTDANGQAGITFDIPEFSGELRLMALAYKGDKFGSAQKAMKVSDPIVLTAALPRFLSPNDSMIMPITAFNTTDKSVKLKFEIETTGGIVAPVKTAELELGANQERFVTVPLKASKQVGKATVIVRTKAFGETIQTTTELPIRTTAPYISEGISNFIEGNTSVTHKIDGDFLQFGRKAYISLSPFPVANFAKELKYLIGYPHGCIEQTTSKAFPQIYLRDIAAILDPSILSTGSPTYFVNEAITKIVSMQMPDGGFSYWPGGDHEYPWTTVYATHFLLEAKKAGYAVPEATIKSALTRLKIIARGNKTVDYYSYGPDGKHTVRRIADKNTIYALYILAIAGSPELTVMNYYRTDKGLLTTDTRYLLSAAFALSGDRRTSVELLPPEFAPEEPYRQTGGNFDSPVRANALILNVLLESDVNNPRIAMYMDYLSKQYKTNRWYSTQDNAFTLLAFGKAARMANSTKIQGSIKVGEKTFPYTGGNQKIDIDPFGKNVILSMNGEGRVYYSIVTTGIRTDGKIPIIDKSLQIRREFFKRDGSVADVSSVKQNELLVVKLTLSSSVSSLDNIAITDLLPGGFEIENPRLTESSNYSFIQNATTPDYMDIRDDRINIYTSFNSTARKQFYYMVRAVTAGTYQYAPVTAEAMYNADYYSGNGGIMIKVIR